MKDQLQNGCGPSKGAESRGLEVGEGHGPPVYTPGTIQSRSCERSNTNIYRCVVEIKMKAKVEYEPDVGV